MREIKFRAWDNIGKEMTEVDTMLWNHPAPKDGWNPKYLKLKYNDNTFSEMIHIFDHKHFVNIMQYTGFHDKNGKEIFEGDIINIRIDKKGDVGRNFSIIWFDGAWYLNDMISSLRNFTDEYGDKCNNDKKVIIEIKGNIYENPKLLTK